MRTVDRFLPHIAACLRDESPLLRKHAIIAITQLLLEDYVKWRGPLFFQYLIALADPDPTLRQMVESRLRSSLVAKVCV